VPAVARKSSAVTTLETVVTKLRRSTPAKAYPLLHDAFLVYAGAGELAHAGALVRLAYDPRLPRPSKRVTVSGTGRWTRSARSAGSAT
jgi:hypothetical protein